MNLSYEVILAMPVGILCLLAIILLCLKKSQKTYLQGTQPANEANIKLSSGAHVGEAKVDINSAGQALLEDIKESEGTLGNNLTKAENEQPYAEINLDCPADVTYSTIQEASYAKAPGKPHNHPLEGDYSTIETLSYAGFSSSKNPYSTFDEKPVAPVIPKPRGIKNHFETANDSKSTSYFEHLYSKVAKKNNIRKNYSLNDLVDKKDKVSKDFQGVNETKFARNSVIGIAGDFEKIQKSADRIYSQVNKERKSIAVLERSIQADSFTHETSKKSASKEGHLYSCIENEVEKIEQDVERSSHYEDINISA